MIIKILAECKKRNKLIAISLIGSEAGHIGYVQSFTENEIVLSEINVVAKHIKDKKYLINLIREFTIDDIYNSDLECLKNKFPTKKTKAKFLTASKFNIELPKLQKSMQICKFICLDGSYYLGKIFHYDDEYIMIDNITYQGFKDGQTIIPRKSMKSIRTGGNEELKIEILFNYKNP